MRKRVLMLLSDFDGTMAMTFVPSPHGIGVNEAYVLAIEILSGDDVVPLYHEVGGLQNRAPGELMELLIEHDDALITRAIGAPGRSFASRADDHRPNRSIRTM